MKFIQNTIPLLTGLFASIASAAGDEPGVVGGYNATVEEFPFVAFLLLTGNNGKQHTCTGSVIAPRTILTAAHCTENTSAGSARIGSTFSHTGGRVITTTGFDNHPAYNQGAANNFDIALLYLSEDATVNGAPVKYGLIPPTEFQSSPGQAARFAGFGAEVYQGGAAPRLQQTQFQIDGRANCRNNWSPTVITENMDCFTSRTFYQGSSTCQGDSGGAYTDPSNRYLIAVASFGIRGCTADYYPAVGIDTYASSDFINRNIR